MSTEGKHILLIEDDPYMHDTVRMILEPEGYRVTGCLTGPAGLAALRRERPDLILLDVMLATPSEGFHLAYEIRSDEALRSVPIIILSAIGQTMGIDFARETGSDYLPIERFLEKPFQPDELRDAVRDVLSREGVRS